MAKFLRPWPALKGDHPLVTEQRRCALCEGFFREGEQTCPVNHSVAREDAWNAIVDVAHFNCGIAFNRGVMAGIDRGEEAYQGEGS